MTAKPRKVSLALQGGGAHGAFAWGVLDALLEDGRIRPGAITATSAGAMNAVVYADGYRTGGDDGARSALEAFWRKVSKAGGPFRPLPGAPWMTGAGDARGPLFSMIDAWTRVTSPYDLNPFDYNPLRDILVDSVDFDALSACRDLDLFICATSVKTGKARIFDKTNLTHKAVMASACLPYLFQAVEIDGEPYWDGGFSGNPALWPLYYSDTPRDIVIVHLNPLERDETPKSASDILNRVNEVTFNAALLAELRALAFVKELIANDRLAGDEKTRLRDMLVHAIRADDTMRDLPADSKFDTSWSALTHLRDQGRATAFDWLDKCANQIGERSTVDLHGDFLDR